MTSPSILNNGPPELPWLIEASVWIKLSYLPILISLLIAEIIPWVTVPPKPNGFPIARTQSPTLALSESAKLTAGNFSSDLIFNTATSLIGSVPTISASYSLPLVNLTIIPSAFWMTWLLVITVPSSLMTKPDPNAVDLLFWGPWFCSNSLKKSSKGEPGGNWKGKGWDLVSTIVVAEIFTTDGIDFSASFENPFDTSLENAAVFKFWKNKMIKKYLKIVFMI